MLLREAQVIAVAHDRVTLRLRGSACSGCEGGCGGRCNLFADARDAEISLPTVPGVALLPGQPVTLTFSDRALRHAAYAGYGRALLAMLVGALAGNGLASLFGMPSDPLVLAGLVLGVAAVAWRTGDVRINPMLTTREAHLASSSPTSQEFQEPL